MCELVAPSTPAARKGKRKIKTVNEIPEQYPTGQDAYVANQMNPTCSGIDYSQNSSITPEMMVNLPPDVMNNITPEMMANLENIEPQNVIGVEMNQSDSIYKYRPGECNSKQS